MTPTPTGLDLSPEKPEAVRVSRKAGLIAVGVGGAVLLAFGYGLRDRQKRQESLALSAAKPDATKMTAATDAAKQVTLSMREPGSKARDKDEEERRSGRGVSRPAISDSHGRASEPMHRGGPETSQQIEPTPEERRRELMRQRELEAVQAPTGTGAMSSRDSSGTGPREQASGASAQSGDVLTGLMGALGKAGQGSVASNGSLTGGGGSRIALLPNASEEYAGQNNQERKEEFLTRVRQVGKDADYLKSTRSAPLDRYEIKAGWDIPAVLEQALNSDLPGELRALVRENVYDTASGNWLLIPQGARLVGAYDSDVSYGQGVVQVIWNRIIFPDGSSISLEGMVGQDAKGNAGFRHTVDNHYKRLLGFGLLTSALTAAFYLTQNRRADFLTQPSAAELVGTAVGSELARLSAEVTRRNMNIQPTIKIPIGYRFNVRVNRDILFEGPYKPVKL